MTRYAKTEAALRREDEADDVTELARAVAAPSPT